MVKGVLFYVGIVFMFIVFIINLVVLFLMYVVFGSMWEVLLLCVVGSFVVVFVVGNIIVYFYKGIGFKECFLKYEVVSEKVVVLVINLVFVGGFFESMIINF